MNAALGRAWPEREAARTAAITTPGLDLALGGGLSIPIVLALLVAAPGFDHERLNERLLLASALFNWPHFMASFGLLYGSKEKVLEHRFASITVPIGLALGAVGVTVAAAWTPAPLQLASLLTSGYLAWHYTGQAFGMVNAFARVDGAPLGASERGPIRFSLRMLLVFHLLWLHYLVPDSLMPAAAEGPIRLAYTGMLWLLPAAFAIGSVGVARYWRRLGRRPAWRVLAPFAAVHLWYVLLANEPGGLVIVQLFHAVQYLIFPLRVRANRAAREAVEAGRAGVGDAHALRGIQVRRVAVYLTLLFVSGVAVLYVLPSVLGLAVRSVWHLAAPAFAAGVAVQIVVNVHHYLTDATVWKLSDPRVRHALFGHLEGEGA